jgi:LacI family transcriptional regulator
VSVTRNDVAERAGVSAATVSYVLTGSRRVAPNTRARVETAIAQLGYERNDLARAFRLRRTETLGLIIPNITNSFFAEAARGVQDFADRHGYTVIICNTDDDPHREETYVRLMRLRRVDGLLAAPCGRPEPFARLVETGVPLVWMDREIAEVPADVVTGALYAGAYEAVSYLLQKDHRRIGTIAGPQHTGTGRHRLEGYEQAQRDHGVTVDPALVKVGDYRQDTASRLCGELLGLADRPTAIFCANNLSVLGVYAAIREHQLSIPGDVAVVGFDDPPWARWINPALTCVNQPAYEIGARAARRLFERLADADDGHPRREVVPSPFVVRDST